MSIIQNYFIIIIMHRRSNLQTKQLAGSDSIYTYGIPDNKIICDQDNIPSAMRPYSNRMCSHYPYNTDGPFYNEPNPYSKTIKGKYKYMADLCSTASTLVSTKLSAVKEINNTITTCHKLEMQRLKDIKNSQSQQQDDDKYMADLYNAYINTGHDFQPSDMSYSDLLDYWIEKYCYVNLKYHTIEAYQSIIKNFHYRNRTIKITK